MNPGTKLERRVRVTIEGRVFSDLPQAIYVHHGGDKVTRIKRSDDVVVEELGLAYDWREGDVVQMVSRLSSTFTLTRSHDGTWAHLAGGASWNDDSVTGLVDGNFADSYPTVRVLRYQAGGVAS